MAHASLQLIQALRETAARLRNGANYSWGHHGACNCGNLLQVITSFNEKEILRFAQTARGEWTELSAEYCADTSAPVEMILSSLQNFGLTPTDIHHLEYLTDRDVLDRLDGGFRWLRKNERSDVISYFETFANLLEDQLAETIRLDIAALLRHPSVAPV